MRRLSLGGVLEGGSRNLHTGHHPALPNEVDSMNASSIGP